MKLVLIEKLERLVVRDLMIQETIVSDFHKRGFELIGVAEPDLLNDDPSCGKLGLRLKNLEI